MKAIGRYLLSVLVAVVSLTPTEVKASSPTAHYWIDHNKLIEGSSQFSGDYLSMDLDVSGLNPGGHTLYYRIQDEDGKWSAVTSVIFVRTPRSGGDTKSCEYWIDKNIDQLQKVTATDNVTFFNIDCEDLAPGAHGLYYRVEDQFGNFSSPICQVFYKNPPVGSNVAWYRYWWNDRYDLAEEVAVATEEPIFMLDTNLTIPDYAVDKYNDSHTACLYMIFGDDTGNISEVLDVDINYDLYLAGINDIQAEATWRYRTNGNTLTLSGLTPGKGILRIFSLDGRQIHAEIPDEDSVTYTIEMEKIVIVCYDGASKKVILR